MTKISFSIAFCLIMGTISSAQTLTSVEEVYKIFQERCVSCHKNAAPAGGLDLEGVGASNYQKATYVSNKLINKTPINAYAAARGNKLVYAGRPDRSFIFRKINGSFEPTIAGLHADEGEFMPNAYPNDILPVEKEIIRQWILFGAKNIGINFSKAVVEDFYTNGGEKAFPDGPPPAPAPGEGFQVKMGPFYLAPDGEVEYYQKHEVQLPQNVEVNRLDMKIGTYSHHLIVYNFTSVAGSNAIPHGLRTNANHSAINLVAAVQEATDLNLPATTAFKWDKNIVLDLNAHYINYSLTRPYQCEAYLNIYTQPLGTAQQEMFATLLTNFNIPIPNNGNLITHSKVERNAAVDSLYIWGLMGHTHKYGKGYKVWERLANGQKGNLIYDAACPQGVPNCASPWFDYQHIPMRYWQPLHPIKWSNGIIHEAQWINDGPTPLGFGPTSDDEMQVLIAFYTQNQISVGTSEPQPVADIPLVEVSPNPAHSTVTFSVGKNKGQSTVQIFDVNGREVLRQENPYTDQIKVDISHLKAGMYIWHLNGETGKLIVE